MVLQAFFDDSKTDGAALILAGYVASAENWARFSDEWKEVLSIRPRWRRFKASEVCASSDEITRERVRFHYNVIKKHVLADICVAVPLSVFQTVCNECSLTGADANPYFFAWNCLITTITNNVHRLAINQPIELYFDSQSEKTKVLLAWEYLEPQMPRRWRKLIKGMPAFKDDEDVMPLQAADFVAWWRRKAFVERGTLYRNPPQPVPWESDDGAYGHLYGETDYSRIRAALLRSREFTRFRLTTSLRLLSYEPYYHWRPWRLPAEDQS